MPTGRSTGPDDWSEDDREEDPEGPSEDDRRRFGGDTVPCPVCRRAIHDESVSCPHCGHWLEDAVSTSSRRNGPQLAVGLILAVVIAGGGLLWWVLRTLI